MLAVLQGILLADQSEKLDSMNLLRLMSPIAATLTLPAVVLLEPDAPHVAWRLLLTQPGFAALLVGNASLAYVVNFTNFQVTHYTSALTLQVRDLLWVISSPGSVTRIIAIHDQSPPAQMPVRLTPSYSQWTFPSAEHPDDPQNVSVHCD